jgi:threonyl-tRNA synthetase
VTERLRSAGLRATLDDRGESIARKIRDAELTKVPYMLVVGDREQEGNTVGVRAHRHGDQGSKTLEEFVQSVQRQVESRSMA